MPRVQVGYNPGAEALQTTAAPNIQTQMVAHDPNSLKAVQLAEAVASPSAQQQFDVLSKKMIEEERQNAVTEARNMSNDELEKKIKEGTMLPFQSPVRVAAMHHVYGENLYNRLEMDVTARAARGEFTTWQDAEKYLTEQRKTMLGEQDKFTSAGFDKRWPQLINKLQTVQLHQQNAQATEFANTQGNGKLNGVITRLDAGDIKPQDGPQALGDAYRDAVRLKLFATPQDRSRALNGVLTSLTAKGNPEMVEGFLQQKLDNGATVADVVGPDGVAQYRHQLQIVADRNAKLAAQGVIKAEAERTHGIAAANIEKAVATGTYAFLEGQKVVNPTTGVTEDMGENQKKVAIAAINRQVAANNLPLDQQMQVWSTNGLKNPEWEKQIQAGISNLASVGWATDGKNVGELNEQGKAAITRYVELWNTNPAEAEKYAGSDYKLLDDIRWTMERGGKPNVSDAAAFVNQIHRRGIQTEFAKQARDSVETAANAVINPASITSPMQWMAQKWDNMKERYFGNPDVNITSIGSDIKRRSEMMVLSGQVPNAEKALEATIEYYSNPAVTSKIRNTVYLNKDLPSVPKGERVADWMERFIAEGPAKIAADQKIDGSSVRLEPTASGTYVAWNKGIVMTGPNGQVLEYSKDSVSKWINDTYQKDIRDKTGVMNNQMSYDVWAERVKKNYYDSKRNDPTTNGTAALGYITSKGAYDRLKAANMLDKSVPEMVEFFKTKKGK
jgi:hypothetical protein